MSVINNLLSVLPVSGTIVGRRNVLRDGDKLFKVFNDLMVKIDESIREKLPETKTLTSKPQPNLSEAEEQVLSEQQQKALVSLFNENRKIIPAMYKVIANPGQTIPDILQEHKLSATDFDGFDLPFREFSEGRQNLVRNTWATLALCVAAVALKFFVVAFAAVALIGINQWTFAISQPANGIREGIENSKTKYCDL